MRKYLVLILGVLLILCFAVTASAEQADIKLGGKILVRGWYFKNVATVSEASGLYTGQWRPVESDSYGIYTTNAYITLDAKVNENVQGFIELESTYQENQAAGLYFWGNYDTKPDSDLFFRQLWIQYSGKGLLGVPAGIKVGHQLLALGEKQFLRHERFGDDAILVFVTPTKELLIGAVTAKLAELTPPGASAASALHKDDLDAYAVLATYKVDKDNTLGLNYTLIKCDDVRSILSVAPAADTLTFQNLGLHANGNISGITYGAEFDIQFGKLERTGLEDLKFKGVGLFARLGYKVDPVNIRASFAMGSGDDDPLDDENKEFQTSLGTDLVSPFGRFVNYTQIYERSIRTSVPTLAATGSQGQVLTLGNTRTTGIANTTYFNVGLDIMPTKELSLSLDGYILRATKAWDGKDKDVGTEIDFKGSYKIAKNLTYFVEAALFKTGDFYTTGTSPLVTESKNVTQVVHGLSLSF